MPEGLDAIAKLQADHRTVELPLNSNSMAHPGVATAQAVPLAQRSILIVEDEPATALNLKTILVNAGYRVVSTSATVTSARAAMVDHPIDAALLDVNLGGDARVFPLAELLAALLVPFAYVSGHPRRLIPGHLRRPFLAKPYSETDIIELTKQLLA